MSFGTRPTGRAPLGSIEANYGGGGGGGGGSGSYQNLPLLGVGSIWWIAPIAFSVAAWQMGKRLLGVG